MKTGLKKRKDLSQAPLMIGILAIVFSSFNSVSGFADTLELRPTEVTEWKAVYGRIEAKDNIPARARIAGTIIELKVSEGDQVRSGDVIAIVKDEKIDFQIQSIDAQLSGLKASLDNAKSVLDRNEKLSKSGVATTQALDQSRMQVDVLSNQIASAQAQKSVFMEQGKEGSVLAATSGKVLTVPVARNSVIMAGETVATIGGGGFFLRLAIPERHAGQLVENAQIEIDTVDGLAAGQGRLAKIYPEIDNGRVIADVNVDELKATFVNARVLVRLPIGSRPALLLPPSAIKTRYGLDFVTIDDAGKTVDRTIVPGQRIVLDGKPMVEILSGLSDGDKVILP